MSITLQYDLHFDRLNDILIGVAFKLNTFHQTALIGAIRRKSFPPIVYMVHSLRPYATWRYFSYCIFTNVSSRSRRPPHAIFIDFHTTIITIIYTYIYPTRLPLSTATK